jgi:hypothetical protein
MRQQGGRQIGLRFKEQKPATRDILKLMRENERLRSQLVELLLEQASLRTRRLYRPK